MDRKRLEEVLDVMQANIRRHNVKSMTECGHTDEEIADFIFQCEQRNIENREKDLDLLMQQVTRMEEHPDAVNITTH
jgi:hypothetical protein